MANKITPRTARLLAGFEKMSDIAAAMGMPVSTYQSKESGQYTFTIAEGLKFAEVCGCQFTDIDFLWANCPEKRDTGKE